MDSSSYVDFFVRLLAILAAATTVVYQMGRQHRSGLELQKENLKDEQRLEFFDQLSEVIAQAARALGDVSQWGSSVPSALRLRQKHKEIPGFQPLPISYRSTDLLELKRIADRSVITVISTIEYREVIVPEFVIFRYALSQQLKRCHEAFQEFHEACLPLLPVDPPEHLKGRVDGPRVLKEAKSVDILGLEKSGRRMKDAFWTISCYLNDLSREAQNHLLGSIFHHEVHLRMPLDVDALVISSRKEHIQKVEERLKLHEQIHAESLPSRILYPDEEGSWIKKLMPWKR